MHKTFLALTAVLMVAATSATAGDDNWVADFDKAVETAKKENKNLLVDFTGSDWCGWCIKLHDEVFKHEAFLTVAKKDFVLVALDFPKSEELKAKVPNPERNAELQTKYGVRGFPTILLMTADGEVFGRTGYKPGGPEKYVAHMAALRADYDTTMKFVKEWEAADAAAKPALWEKACAIVEKTESATTKEKLKPVVAYAFEIDADNAKGLKLKAMKTMFAAGLADAELTTEAEKLDPNNEHGLCEQILMKKLRSIRSKDAIPATLAKIDELNKAGFKDKTVAFQLLGNAAHMSMRALNDPKKASAYAKQAIAIGSDNERFLKYLKTLVLEDEPQEEEVEEEIVEEEEKPEEKKQP